MWISYTIYKHSVLATIVAFIGSVLVAIGVVQAVDLVFDGKFGLDLIGSIILVAAGVLFHFLARLINDIVVAKKTRKALENPEICKILQSPIGAYKYSKKNIFRSWEYCFLFCWQVFCCGLITAKACKRRALRSQRFILTVNTASATESGNRLRSENTFRQQKVTSPCASISI